MKFFNDILRVSLCLLAALGLLELVMRASGIRFQASFYTSDPERGYALRARAEGWNVGEQENYVRINSRGLRDRDHDLIRPKNTIRIAILGDSETEAVQVPLDQIYFSVMERELNGNLPDDAKVEVISFGVGGYGLAPQYLTLKQQIWQYDPQIVLVVDPADGLILRSSRRLYPGDSFGAPFFDLSDGKLRLDEQSMKQQSASAIVKAQQTRTADLMNQFRFLSLLNSARVKAANDVRQMRAGFQTKAASTPPFPADYWKTFGFLGPANDELKHAWDITEALIAAMRDEATRHHAEFWLCTLDIPAQVDPDPGERRALQKRLGVDTLFRSNQILDDFTAREGIQQMSLASGLAQFASKEKVFLHGFKGTPRNTGHLNEAGHKVVGQLMAAILRERSALLPRVSVGAHR